MNKLHVDSVIKSFGVNQVLTDVYLSCEIGEVIGLLGRNGSGKSTLLKIIFGSLTAERKFVKVGDKIVNTVFDNKNLISYLPQDNFLPSHLSVKQTIQLFLNSNSQTLITSHFFIMSMMGKQNKHLSGGEKRLLEIMLIVYSEAKFVLIDEPFNGVAPVYKDEIKSTIKNQSVNKGFVITDHDYRNILDVSDKVIILHDGGTKAITNNSELCDWGYISDQ